ncbi:class F sortase [Streptomyces sp. 549]|uniref:class F sortase n=1 Tax=Streptomyces sp. 549 TaxID=3049076 RepID=UPI0024C2A92F|nr:class F sortase [Streptomyces sp. 549]MDK1475422.1 class F sortase [Streptomyces sp. 549]
MRQVPRARWFTVCGAAVAAGLVLLVVLHLNDPAPPPDFGGGSASAPVQDRSGPRTPDRVSDGPGRDGGRPPEKGARGGADAQPPRDAAPAPVRLRMERVGVTAGIVPVGVAKDGTAEVPADPAEAGWYRFGPAPGDAAGSAVLVGHVDSDTGELGALAALYDVREGDVLTVRRDSGEPVEYRVSTRRTVPKDELPADVFRRDGPPVLTLVTCAAPYDPDRGGYQNNVVVTAVPAGQD